MELTLFFSWQMETDLQGFDNKKFLCECIENACKKISNKGQLKNVKIKFQEGMRATSGTPEVAREMFRKIDACDIFVADITTAQRIYPKLENCRNKHGIFFRYSPNGNVFGEYNRALGKYPEFDRQIILLANDVNKTALDDNDVIPFDTRSRRWPMYFHLENETDEAVATAKKSLMPELEDAIRMCAKEAIKYYNNRYKPFMTWYKHQEDGRLNGNRLDDSIIEKYRTRIQSPSKAICIIGPNDYRKAYLALKAFEKSDFVNGYFYVNKDDNSEEKFYSALDKILSDNENVILVIDHCNDKDFIRILDIQKKTRKSNRIIFLSSEQYESEDNAIQKVQFDDVISITDDLMNHLEQLFARADIQTNEVKDYIIQFCGNNENFIEIVLPRLPKGINSTDNLAELLTNIITSSTPGSFERTIWQSIALFDCVGNKRERSEEIAFILTNKNLTALPESADYITNACSTLTNKAIRIGWVGDKGNTITITVSALADQLTYEWFANVDIER
ncbi:MAG: hypothetical protein II453_20230, partial [Alphaproteobacteria bacterium]|nr:hypothetical protein [Alphaproteobacteria bacterium]